MSKFETKVKPILTYVGTIGAVLTGIAYVAVVCIMICGFSAVKDFSQSLVFAVINALIGIVIMQLLKIQGIDLAKQKKENIDILKEYYNTKTKDKKLHSIKYYWTTSVIKDILTKGASIAATTIGIIYVVVAGTQDYSMLLMAFVNLLMFACFGLLTLVKAYDFFNEKHMPFIKDQLEKKKEEEEQKNEAERKAHEEAIEREVEKRVEMAKKEFDQQRNDMVHPDRGTNILESSDNICTISIDNQSVVVDNNDSNNCVLGGSIHASDSSTSGIDTGSQKNT